MKEKPVSGVLVRGHGKTRGFCEAILVCCFLIFMGCGSKSPFEEVPLDQPGDNYRSAMWTRQSKVRVEKVAAALRCVVEGDSGEKAAPYGGIVLPGGGAKRWRLELAFTAAEDIMAAYVDGYNSEKKRVVRWQTGWGAALPGQRSAYLFGPREMADGFKYVDSDATGPVDTLHVFVRVKPGGYGSFELYRFELDK